MTVYFNAAYTVYITTEECAE